MNARRGPDMPVAAGGQAVSPASYRWAFDATRRLLCRFSWPMVINDRRLIRMAE
jgi:hypothetical protein